MRAVVHPSQAAGVDVAVDLRRRQRAVAEQLLDGAEVGAALQEMRRECVAEAMRMRGETAQRARVQPPAANGEEERVVRRACTERGRPSRR